MNYNSKYYLLKSLAPRKFKAIEMKVLGIVILFYSGVSAFLFNFLFIENLNTTPIEVEILPMHDVVLLSLFVLHLSSILSLVYGARIVILYFADTYKNRTLWNAFRAFFFICASFSMLIFSFATISLRINPELLFQFLK